MKRKPKYDTPIRIICAVLFATFSFLYIYMFQGELLALVQDHLSQGKTTNNALVTALVITPLLMVLQYLLNRVGELHGRYEAISYLPSCVLLALITKVDGNFSYSWVQWLLALLIVTVLYLLMAWIYRNTFESRDVKFFHQLTSNLGVMAALFVFTGWYGYHAPAHQMELSAWKYVHSEKYDKVLTVGMEADDCNADLTALRNLALAKTGQLGNKLFFYPQSYGSAGLLMNRYNVQAPSYGAEHYYDLLGAYPYGGEKAAAFYKRILQQSNAEEYRSLYAAALLLDKDLETFASLTIDKSNQGNPILDTPIHYQEAWLIYNELYPSTPIHFVVDSTLSLRYQEYLSLREVHSNNHIVMQNLCKRKFGKTYWYYYDFVNAN